ncbi:protein GOS9-like [Silene latifolia]|uniref:protein GOS9-like n=1 Tax=Silene latifolia TaxID=37657 RepID=UPI003D772937
MKLAYGFQKMSYGKYGDGGSPINWSVEGGEISKITKIMIKHGCIIDGIGFQIDDSVIWFSGPGGIISEITLGSNEYITQISGTEGKYKYDCSSKRHVTSLKIHTNVCPHGYGPFGTAEHVSDNSSFITPFVEGNAIVGFCGHFGNFLNSIAISLKPVITDNTL